jgi:hypothetical protein
MSESHATDATDTLEAGHVTRTISRAHRIRDPCANVSDTATCGGFVTDVYHECYQRFCENCKEDRDVDHMCYMRPLKDALPTAGDKVLYVFYYFETTQNTKCFKDKSSLHVPNLVCVQQFCSTCENEEDDDCARCGKMKHSFWDDPAGDLLTYLVSRALGLIRSWRSRTMPRRLTFTSY